MPYDDDKEWIEYLGRCTENAIQNIQKEIATKGLEQVEAELNSERYKASVHTGEIEAGQMRAAEKYRFVRYKG